MDALSVSLITLKIKTRAMSLYCQTQYFKIRLKKIHQLQGKQMVLNCLVFFFFVQV